MLSGLDAIRQTLEQVSFGRFFFFVFSFFVFRPFVGLGGRRERGEEMLDGRKQGGRESLDVEEEVTLPGFRCLLTWDRTQVLKPVISQHTLGTQVIEIAKGGKEAKSVTYLVANQFGTGEKEGKVCFLACIPLGPFFLPQLPLPCKRRIRVVRLFCCEWERGKKGGLWEEGEQH